MLHHTYIELADERVLNGHDVVDVLGFLLLLFDVGRHLLHVRQRLVHVGVVVVVLRRVPQEVLLRLRA
jgi:hypothetical protein